MAKPTTATVRALAQLQAVLREPEEPGAHPVRSGRVPSDLGNATDSTGPFLSLSAKEDMALTAAIEGLLADPTLEHLGDRKAAELLWKFCCAAHLDRATNHVPVFVREHAQPPQQREVFFTVRHLTVKDAFDVAGTRFMPLDGVPATIIEDFAAEQHVGSVIRAEASSSDPQRIVARARERAEHSLRVLRAGLPSTLLVAADRQLRFRLGERYAFADSTQSGWRITDDVSWELTVGLKTATQATDFPVGRLAAAPANDVERRALTALRWTDNALLAADPLQQVLYLFFALEALAGDRSEKEKGRRIAFRRAMLDHVVQGGFRNPHLTYALYDGVRSAAVHGEGSPAISSREATEFGADARSAINEFLEYATAIGATRRNQVMRALDKHADVSAMLDWLRRTDSTGDWAKFQP